MSTLSWAFLVDSVPFTKAVRDGLTSLGGSESACLGLARALKARGHDVHVFATQMDADAGGADAQGVIWHDLDDFPAINAFIEWDVVVGLRQPSFFTAPMAARMRVLWNQDLLAPALGAMTMGVAWALDKSVYVSAYHRAQWEEIHPELAPIGAVTKNGFDPAQVPAAVVKDPNRIIHISRPERGLGPLLAMWPAFKQRNPKATLQICRYQSMYDGEGTSVRATCLAYDEQVALVNQDVGGIEYLGSLNKAQLYQAIADAAVMWYPGIASFAETSCIAAIEAQACGTPFVGSLKGALVETARPSYDAGLLIAGDAMSPEYQAASMAAVSRLLDGCARNTVEYRTLQKAGRAHVETYTYAALAEEWESAVHGWFKDRYESNKLRVLRQLLHEDDHTTAMIVAEEMATGYDFAGRQLSPSERAEYEEAIRATLFCDRVIKGKEQVAEDYARFAIQDPLHEADICGRFKAVSTYFTDCTHVLDIACGNGAGAIRFALDHPTLKVTGVDYAEANIAKAKDAAEKAGVADRCTFLSGIVWDFDRNAPHTDAETQLRARGETYDGLFVGEFVEHIADCAALVDWLETFVVDGAQVVYTCPSGPFVEIATREMQVQRSHVHHFRQDDVHAVWSKKLQVKADYLSVGHSPRWNSVGNWLIHYRTAPNRPAGSRDHQTRALRTRPNQRLSVGLITKDAENDLGRCLTSVWGIADEIIVGDTGSTDQTKAIAEAYGATVIDLPAVLDHPQGFAGVRNAVLDACTGDWFLWIDADEQLINPHKLRPYLDGAIYNGYVLHQTHVYLDGPPTFDVPQRLFRVTDRVRFYGCVHEQPQDGDPNVDIQPALDVADPVIAHTGYLTANGREHKRVSRNRPLLARDQHAYGDRLLGKVLLIREAVIESDLSYAKAGGELTERAEAGYHFAVDIFERYFDDPEHKFFEIARPWYEAALQKLGIGWEAEVALAGKAGGLKGARAKPERLWVRDADEFERILNHRVKAATAKMRPPTYNTDPFIAATSRVEVTA